MAVDGTSCPLLSNIPETMDASSLNMLLELIDKLNICPGHPDLHFVKMVSAKKGKILSHDGKVSAYVDDNTVVKLNGETYTKTVRTSKCELLCKTAKCSSCKSYRVNLRSMYASWTKRSQQVRPDEDSSSSHTNDRYLNTPEKKSKIDSLKKRARHAEKKAAKLFEKIENITRTDGNIVSEELHNDLVTIMTNNDQKVKDSFPEGSFRRLFWEQQLKAAGLASAKQMRWHPLIIRWCLNIKLLSSSSYHALRTSGCLCLPSERTLRDYTNVFEQKVGYQPEVMAQLLEEINSISHVDEHKYVSILLDEMKIKEGLVYNKFSGEVIGFTDLGTINDEFASLEQNEASPSCQIATHILAVMVRGILFSLEFPLAHFSTVGVTGDYLFTIAWEAIRLLETADLKVLCVVCDGASPNRKYFRMHKQSNDHSLCYKSPNVYAQDERYVYFVADPPHLMKTTRNCWSKSGIHGTRHMQVGNVLWYTIYCSQVVVTPHCRLHVPFYYSINLCYSFMLQTFNYSLMGNTSNGLTFVTFILT